MDLENWKSGENQLSGNDKQGKALETAISQRGV
jgi:hypothetical protein